LDKPKTPRGGPAFGLQIALAKRCQLRRYLKPLSRSRRIISVILMKPNSLIRAKPMAQSIIALGLIPSRRG
jgi:hypothetical protein